MDVGIRELKQHLSDYLDRVASGETIRVTDRGIPKATISPIAGQGGVDRGIAEGWIRPATQQLQPSRRYVSKLKIRDVIAEDRA